MKKNSLFWHWITSQLPTPTEKKSMYADITNSVVSPYAKSKSTPVFSYLFSRRFGVGIALVLVFIYTTNQASAHALPGDLAYPIKLAREEITLITKQTPEKKAEYIIKRIETRIEEKNILIETKQLDKADSLVVDNLIAKSTETFNEQIVDIQVESSVVALDYQNTLTAILDTHSETLLATSSDEITSPVAVLALEQQQEHAATIKTELEKKVTEIDPLEAEQQYYEKIATLDAEYPDTFPKTLLEKSIPQLPTQTISDQVIPAIDEPVVESSTDTPAEVKQLSVIPVQEETPVVVESEEPKQKTFSSAIRSLFQLDSEPAQHSEETPIEPTSESTADTTPVIETSETPAVLPPAPEVKPQTIPEFIERITDVIKNNEYSKALVLLSDMKIVLQKQKLEAQKNQEIEEAKKAEALKNKPEEKDILPVVELEQKTETKNTETEQKTTTSETSLHTEKTEKESNSILSQ